MSDITYNIRVDKQIYDKTDALLRDAEEIDTAIANSTAKIYDSLDELFASWKNDD